jgi:hypothetical protein
VWGVESSKFFAVRVFGHGGVDILPL